MKNIVSIFKSALHKNKVGSEQNYVGQIDRVRAAFEANPATMLMIAHQTGIERANICRYVAKLKKANMIILIKRGICPISKHEAGFYSTNKAGLKSSC